MGKNTLFLAVFFWLMCLSARAQIEFLGGEGDGGSQGVVSNQDSFSGIFGGADDGFACKRTATNSNNVFNGADNDGFAAQRLSSGVNPMGMVNGDAGDGYAWQRISTGTGSAGMFEGDRGDGYAFHFGTSYLTSCLGDLNFDGVINTQDLLILIGEYACEFACAADLNDTPGVDTTDLLLLLGLFGTSCP